LLSLTPPPPPPPPPAPQAVRGDFFSAAAPESDA
jgi:hypothetical protein